MEKMLVLVNIYLASFRLQYYKMMHKNICFEDQLFRVGMFAMDVYFIVIIGL